MGGLVSTKLSDKSIALNESMSTSEKINIFANVFEAPGENGGGGISISNVTKLGI
jgi:hypothetical protein